MIHYWKALDLEITDGEHQFDRTYTGWTIPSQTLNHKHVEIIKFWDKPNYIIGKLLTWKSQILNITMIRHPQLKLHHLKPQTLKHVEIIKLWDKPTYDTILENSWLEDHRLWISPWSETLKWNHTISNLKPLNMKRF